MAHEREEETWAQLAAKVPPNESSNTGGTQGTSRSVGLIWKNKLQGTSSVAQIAALGLEQRPIHPTIHPKSSA